MLRVSDRRRFRLPFFVESYQLWKHFCDFFGDQSILDWFAAVVLCLPVLEGNEAECQQAFASGTVHVPTGIARFADRTPNDFDGIFTLALCYCRISTTK